MKKVIIYSTRICPYCIRAKNFFNKKNIDYTEIMIDQDPSLIAEMVEKSGRQSVPQIFIGDYHVGGFDVGLDVLEFIFRSGVQHHAKTAQTTHAARTHVVHRFTHLREKVREFGLRVHFQAVQPGNTLHLGGDGTEFDIEGIRRGMGWVARNQQHP